MMTRLMSLTLNNVKNVRHGTVDFPVLASGGSVTGIYGANGSGKTSVIDALALLKQTMSGMPIAASSGELVTIGESSMTLTAVFLMEIQSRHYVKYSVEYRKQDTGLGVEKESLSFLDSPEQAGRPIVVNDNAKDTELGLSPDYLWRSLALNHGGRNTVIFARRDVMLERRSYLFSDDFLGLVSDVESNGGELSLKAMNRIQEVVSLSTAVRQLKRYAWNSISILSTKNTASVSYSLLPLSLPTEDDGPSARFLDLLGENVVIERDMEKLNRNVRMFNQVLPMMVSGLTIRLKEIDTKLMDDGNIGVRFEPVSVRDGMEVPLRNESEGIVRIVGMLAYLIQAFNNPNACVAIDELDTGIFEYLFGEMLGEFAKGAQGQLIFTAHNLRPMERMQPTSDTIVLSTLDPRNRFIPYRGLGKTNNPRRQYFNALELGGTTVPLYKEGMPQLIGAGFTLAGNEHDQIDQQVEDGMRALLDVPVDGLEEALW